MVKTHAYSYYTYYNYFLTPCLSPLDFWSIECHSIFFQFQTWKKNCFRNKLDFLSSSNLIFTACVACKNQFRNQIDFLIFQTWHFEIEKKLSDTRYLKNQVEIDRGSIYQVNKLSYQTPSLVSSITRLNFNPNELFWN